MDPAAPAGAARERYDHREMRLASARMVVVLLAAGLVTVAAGCGGGGKNGSPPPTTTITKSTTTSGGSPSAPAFASAKNCQAMAGLAAKAAAAIEASGNPAAALHTEAAELQALAKAAPSEIRADIQTFAAAFSGFLQALQHAGYKLGSKTPPTAAQAAAFAKAARSFDTPKLKQAEQHLSAWAHKNCTGVHVGG